jgi:hypothetical protein
MKDQEFVRRAFVRAIAAKYPHLREEHINNDVYIARRAPGQWSPHAVLEIYTENGIPNPLDSEWLGDGLGSWDHSETWQYIEAQANEALVNNGIQQVLYEPYHSGVVNVFWIQPTQEEIEEMTAL